VKVYTIDRYQGDENDFIFLSLTRSVSERTNCKPSLGFLASPNRTCVALSRARMGLYVFGCSSLFQQHPPWCVIVEYFRQRNKLRREL
ncbi:C-terminal helicase domain-containing protein, partial [Acinetobacter baumannii]